MSNRLTRALMLVAIILASAGTGVPARATSGVTKRLSVSSDGAQANGPTPAVSVPDTTSPDLSLDGLTVAFSSDASNLVAGDTNAAADIFLRRTLTGEVTRASVTPSGAQANGASYSPSLSVDGRYLAFASEATNLVKDDANGKADVFLKDMKTGSIKLMSQANNGDRANGASNSPFVSLFGDYVTFESEASNLSKGDSNVLTDAFYRDVARGHTSRLVAPPVEQDEQPHVPERTWTAHARVSYDGTYVVYARGATRTSPEHPTALDVFLLDRATRKTRQLTVAAWAGSFPTMSEEPVISADGRYVAFTSWSVWNNDLTLSRAIQQPSPLRQDDALVRNDFDYKDIWYYDRLTKTTVPMSTSPLGPVADGDNYHPSISADGHQIAFISDATNLIPGETNKATDVYVRDLEERTTARVSLGGVATQANGASPRASVSYEGKRVAFASGATNLVASDTNLVSDIFMRDRLIETPNAAPVLATPFEGLDAVNQGEEVGYRLRARDANGDPLRYGIIINHPADATIDPLTGQFSWKVGPDPTYYAARTDARGVQENFQHSDVTGGRCIFVVFWVEDIRGQSAFAMAKYFVRDAERTARCMNQHACYAKCETRRNGKTYTDETDKP